MAQVDKSFRPLAGSKVSERWIRFLRPITVLKFPSPRGGVRFLNLNAKQVEAAERNGFRPLAGIKVPERHGEQRNAPKSGPVSVPLRGVRFLNLPYDEGIVSYNELPSPLED